MTLKEIKQLLNGEKVQGVSSRKRYAFITRNEQNELVVLDEKESIGKIEELARELPVNEVKGMPAFAGTAKGKAKIIPLSLNPELHLPKICDGDIIVADTTGPELMLAIQKAKAIVTDEGGLMSHAAVIAREFRIPCIVGTKNGTKVFKDNDLIEVDAFKGIARKIKE
jgi:pyruvate,water dikinase